MTPRICRSWLFCRSFYLALLLDLQHLVDERSNLLPKVASGEHRLDNLVRCQRVDLLLYLFSTFVPPFAFTADPGTGMPDSIPYAF